jgi:hypothetical protein
MRLLYAVGLSESEERIEALRDCWNVGVRKASGDAWVKGRAINCDSCVGSAINLGGIVTVWPVELSRVRLLVGTRMEIFDEAEKCRAGPRTWHGPQALEYTSLSSIASMGTPREIVTKHHQVGLIYFLF